MSNDIELGTQPETPEVVATSAVRTQSAGTILPLLLATALFAFVVGFFPPPVIDDIVRWSSGAIDSMSPEQSGQFWNQFLTEVPYFLFFVIFIGVAVAAFARGVALESRLRAVTSGGGDLLHNSLLSPLAKHYRATMRKTRTGKSKTSYHAEDFFGPDAILASSSASWFPLMGILKSVPGSFTGLGILGTFVGFAVGLNGFRSDTAANIQSSIQELVVGIHVGFNYSMLIRFLAIFLSRAGVTRI